MKTLFHRESIFYVWKIFLCLEDNEDNFYKKGDYLLNRKDVINLKDHSDYRRLNGCCGLDGCDGINKVCLNGHEIGTEKSDCWTPHSLIIGEEKVCILKK